MSTTVEAVLSSIGMTSKMLETNNIEIDIKKRVLHAMDLIFDCIKTGEFEINRKTIEKYERLRKKLRKNIMSASNKYITLTRAYSVFSDEEDHIEFCQVFKTLEISNSTKLFPQQINQLIAELATGRIHICADEKCTKELLIMYADEAHNARYIHCSVTNRYWCNDHSADIFNCEECDALQYFPGSTQCYECEELICENPNCLVGVDVNKGCYSCGKVQCLAYDHDDALDLWHCTECMKVVCEDCWQYCDLCDSGDTRICAECAKKYTVKCDAKTSKRCKEEMIIHPKCEKKQRNTCNSCCACKDGKDDTFNFQDVYYNESEDEHCRGFKCHLCKAVQS